MRTVKGHMSEALTVRYMFVFLLMLFVAGSASARMEVENDGFGQGYNPGGIFEFDGDFVMNVGEVQINITNWGLIGSAYSNPSTYSDAPSCQWPAGSGDEYLWAAGLWVGGVVLGERLVSSGGRSSEWMPLDELEATIYEAIGTKLMRPSGNPSASGRRAPMPGSDDDDDGTSDEEILNGKDDDFDGFIDEDFGQVGNQMMVLTNYDNTALSQERFPDHTPMNLEVVQSSYAWENDQVDDFVGFEYKITNIGVTDIQRVYVGFFADSDIGPRSGQGTAEDDMAGSFTGFVRATDNSWVPVEVGFMWDNDPDGPIEGYFGIVFLGHDIDPSGAKAPRTVGLRTFQKFQGSTAFEQGGDPTNDDEAYQLMSAGRDEWDADTIDGKEADFRFMVSAGPFDLLEPDDALNFQVGMVVGPGLGDILGSPGLLSHCAEAAQTWYGVWVDEIPDQIKSGGGTEEVPVGENGRETMLCQDDFDLEVWDTLWPDFGDTSCVGLEWLLGQNRVGDDDLFDYTFPDGEEKTCAMFNMDNCFECYRQLGYACNESSIEMGVWNCNDPNVSIKPGCTGIDGAETQIHWLVGMAPPPPGLRVWAGDSRVHVFWDDTSENTADIRLQKIDFESYRIWRADNWDRPHGSSVVNGPESNLWQLINEYDLVNNYVVYREGVEPDTIPLGSNTGLEIISYTPVVLSNPDFYGLADAMQGIVDNDPGNNLRNRPLLRGANGAVLPEYASLIQWEGYPDVLDTFFAVAFRSEDEANGVLEKRSTKFYEYIDREIHNGFVYFYSVTATDHALLAPMHETGINLPVGPGLGGDPGSSFQHTTPGTEAQTAEDRAMNGANIYVFPNPATRDALADYQQMAASGDDPTGVRVTFTNLPAAVNTIEIFTVSGDLVQTIDHDGTDGEGHISWNLMSRNGQEIVSGVYLYTVHSNDGAFDDFIGKFVVVR
ncbi:MAG: hypothetical protein GY780_09865 [bacterium]|nr:hypothetical protein [bacterium]